MTALPTLGAVLTATLCLLVACGGTPGGDAGDSEAATSSPLGTASSSSSPTTGVEPEDLVLPPSGGDVVLSGTVEAGVEPGCLLLQASGVLHLLVGVTEGLGPGVRVTVQGRPDPGLTTTCQEGTPFVVTSSSPA
jgi:hypothetical protein